MRQTLYIVFNLIFSLFVGANTGFAQERYVAGKLYAQVAGLSGNPSLLEPFGVQSTQIAFPALEKYLPDVYEIEVVPGKEDRVKEMLSQFQNVKFVERIPFVHAHFIPDDYDSTLQTFLQVIRAPEAWDLTQGSESVVIAIVDNGIFTDHSDLVPNLWENPGEIPGDSIDNDRNGYIDDIHGWDIGDWDNDVNIPSRWFRHGTHVAGLASASTHNSNGVASIGFNCSLMGVKIPSDTGQSDTYTFSAALQGVEYAIAAGADIINMSFGGTEYLNTGQLLMDVGHELGVVFVAAAGNGPGDNNPATTDTTYEYPAMFSHVISVGATDLDDKIAGFSTYNSKIDVMAPGLGIWSTVPSSNLNSSYGFLSGSSQATPIVSGLMGLILSMNPCLTPVEAEAILKAGCARIDSLNPGYEGRMGAGRIDAAASLALILRQSAPVADFTVWDSVSCLGGGVRIFYDPLSAMSCPETWSWSCSNGQASSLMDPVFVVDTPGVYGFSLVVENAFGKDSMARNVEIVFGEMPLVEAGNDTVIAWGDTARLRGSGNAVKYAWSPTLGLVSGQQNMLAFAVPDVTTDYVLAGTSMEGCVSRDVMTVTVLGTNAVDPVRLGPLRNINPVYPNPARPSVTLSGDFEEKGELEISLYTIDGKVIKAFYQDFVFPGEFLFRWEADKNISPGVYVIRWKMKEFVFQQQLILR